MQISTYTFLLFWTVFHFSDSTVLPPNRIQINIPTVEEEATYIWRNLQDLAFFEKHNYQLSLPPGKFMTALKEKSRKGHLTEEDYPALVQFLEAEVYRKEDYLVGYQKIEEQRGLLNRMIHQLSKGKRNWSFREFPTYAIHLTLYGPGGSYNPDDGSIIIMTNPKGGFKQDPNPANTLIHEIVHIGIEASIVQEHQVPHALKERIVDHFVLLNFSKELPKYRVQNMGDTRIDALLKRKSDLKNLATLVAEFLEK